MTQALILAAGRGQRLSAATNGTPKCLVRVGGVPLIERQLDLLNDLGVDRVGVVVGHRADEIRSRLGSRCDFIVNERFEDTNSLYSLWLARKWVSGSLVLMNCDVLAHPDVYHRVLACCQNALAYDSTSGAEPEEMKVALEGQFVQALSKSLPPEEVDGENVGILKFDPDGCDVLFEEADRIVRDGGEGHWAPAAVERLARRRPVRAVNIAGLPWTEIDFPCDLQVAENDVSPSIAHGRWSRTKGVAEAKSSPPDITTRIQSQTTRAPS